MGTSSRLGSFMTSMLHVSNLNTETLVLGNEGSSKGPSAKDAMLMPGAIENFKSQDWRIRHLYRILDKDANEMMFYPNKAQEEVLMNFWHMNLILKARQIGFTTLMCILLLDTALFNSNIHAAIVAHTREDAEYFFEDKVKFAYTGLPLELRQHLNAPSDSARKLTFSNGSSIRVGTSLRGGTYQLLHVSEFGKICAQYPAKAREIVTGAFNTVAQGQHMTVESTAEGAEGYFHKYVQDAHNRDLMGKKPNIKQFKLFFFPWWQEPAYVMNPEMVFISKEQLEYFEELETKHQIYLSAEQKAWWAETERQQGDDMYREYPATIEEAFRASTLGAYYKVQMAQVRKKGQIRRVPAVPGVRVNTGWDLGKSDDTTIWLHQRIGMEDRIVGYYENSGEDLAHYVKWLDDTGYLFGTHFIPHDAAHKRQQKGSMIITSSTEGKSQEDWLFELGLRNIHVVKQTADLGASIETTRKFLVNCWFDEEDCQKGIPHLDNFRKRWNKNTGAFMEEPLKTPAIHGADGFRTLSAGLDEAGITSRAGDIPGITKKTQRRRRAGWRIS